MIATMAWCGKLDANRFDGDLAVGSLPDYGRADAAFHG
jgi:hypothetical protein